MIRHAHFLTGAFAAIYLFPGSQQVLAQDPNESQEYAIKAAYLFNFFRYFEWPQNAPGNGKVFVVGVVGPNVFGKSLDTLGTKTIDDRKIVVHHFPTADSIKPCHILFIAADDKTEKRMAQAVEKTKDTPVLLVSDTEGFARKGAVVNFIIESNNVKFEINPDAAKRAGLKVNAKLLTVAKVVRDAP